MRDDSTALPEVPNEPRLPRAPGQHDLAVEMRHLRRARLLVQVVDVLGDDPDFVGPLEVHQGPMGGIVIGPPDSPPPLVVELQHDPGIRRPGLGGRNVLDPVAFLEPVGTAKGLQAALGTDPGPGEHDDTFHWFTPFAALHTRPNHS